MAQASPPAFAASPEPAKLRPPPAPPAPPEQIPSSASAGKTSALPIGPKSPAPKSVSVQVSELLTSLTKDASLRAETDPLIDLLLPRIRIAPPAETPRTAAQLLADAKTCLRWMEQPRMELAPLIEVLGVTNQALIAGTCSHNAALSVARAAIERSHNNHQYVEATSLVLISELESRRLAMQSHVRELTAGNSGEGARAALLQGLEKELLRVIDAKSYLGSRQVDVQQRMARLSLIQESVALESELIEDLGTTSYVLPEVLQILETMARPR